LHQPADQIIILTPVT